MSRDLKGKKVACFVALPHHTRFLSPLMDQLERRGAIPLYFTVMGDFPFERDLVKKGKTCRILQAYATDETRQRLDGATREFWDLWAERCTQWDGLRHWPMVLQSSLLSSGLEEYFCLEAFIRREQPDVFVALHERNRWGKLIGHLATRYHIPLVTLQEGDYYEDRLSFSGHTEYSTALMLWGEDTKERLVRLRATSEKMVLIGNTHLSMLRKANFQADRVAETKRELNIPPGKPVVLFLVGLQWGVVKDVSIWREFLNGLGDDVVKVFKWHPKVTYPSYKKNTEDAFREHFPSCVVVQNYDPYRLLPIADYCVTLGKTTLAVEALSFGKPLFSLPGRDGEVDHYAKGGISQPVWPPGNWEALYRTIKDGVPEKVRARVEQFLGRYFYRVNAESVERGAEVIRHIVESRARSPRATPSPASRITGRVSYIVPSGADESALVRTLTALSDHVTDPDWEVVVVVHHDSAHGVVGGLSGDVRIVESRERNLAALYNQGAAASTGESLIFLRPGVEYVESVGVSDAARRAVVGIPLWGADAEPYCLGIAFDFNHVPVRITHEASDHSPEAVGGGFLGMPRHLYDALGGFDERIADHLVEVDMCLSAKQDGYDVRYVASAAGRVMDAAGLGEETSGAARPDEGWQGRVGFFAKWVGRLPKNDDFPAFAGPLLKV
ncbi:MAG: hypothetical protein ACOYXR_00850 [Nitrospirota bacterium]